ncbi:hypothetical protein [Methylocella silvestris]|uniref:Uncharacterized protein n=1 Tax=Methylocella silvestris TaxID=199596 RepID=A0A2J7TKJ3_METSI|nr:hypothetical protein [Methylocella silvestris]PNG27300.1 hypothetical protein CR492_04290 [Methylocella silvestris]
MSAGDGKLSLENDAFIPDQNRPAAGSRLDGLRQFAEMCVLYAMATVAFFLIFFKFSPDAGFVYFYNMTNDVKLASDLVSVEQFKQHYLSSNSINYPRFLGNLIVYDLSNWIGALFKSTDPRLNPLRLSAAVVACVSFYIATVTPVLNARLLDRKTFFCLFAFMCLIGQYVYYPGDMSSLAFLSLSLYFVLQEKFIPAAIFMLATGLFRESAFHVVFFVAVWAACDWRMPLKNRAALVLGFAVLFVVEYKLIRLFYPAPISVVASETGIETSITKIFFERGLWSLTTVATLALHFLFLAYYFVTRDGRNSRSWRDRFFLVNCLALPLWIIFYRMLGGNISEFRLLFPALLPIVYGVAYNARSEWPTDTAAPIATSKSEA